MVLAGALLVVAACVAIIALRYTVTDKDMDGY